VASGSFFRFQNFRLLNRLRLRDSRSPPSFRGVLLVSSVPLLDTLVKICADSLLTDDSAGGLGGVEGSSRGIPSGPATRWSPSISSGQFVGDLNGSSVDGTLALCVRGWVMGCESSSSATDEGCVEGE
jgi:hypothetical protein